MSKAEMVSLTPCITKHSRSGIDKNIRYEQNISMYDWFLSSKVRLWIPLMRLIIMQRTGLIFIEVILEFNFNIINKIIYRCIWRYCATFHCQWARWGNPSALNSNERTVFEVGNHPKPNIVKVAVMPYILSRHVAVT